MVVEAETLEHSVYIVITGVGFSWIRVAIIYQAYVNFTLITNMKIAGNHFILMLIYCQTEMLTNNFYKNVKKFGYKKFEYRI